MLSTAHLSDAYAYIVCSLGFFVDDDAPSMLSIFLTILSLQNDYFLAFKEKATRCNHFSGIL
jgi:hypothetical protein